MGRPGSKASASHSSSSSCLNLSWRKSFSSQWVQVWGDWRSWQRHRELVLCWGKGGSLAGTLAGNFPRPSPTPWAGAYLENSQVREGGLQESSSSKAHIPGILWAGSWASGGWGDFCGLRALWPRLFSWEMGQKAGVLEEWRSASAWPHPQHEAISLSLWTKWLWGSLPPRRHRYASSECDVPETDLSGWDWGAIS